MRSIWSKVLVGATLLALGVGVALASDPGDDVQDIAPVDLDDGAIRKLDADADGIADDDDDGRDGDGDDTRGDDGTNDLLVSGALRTNELQVWFLAEHLAGVPVARAEENCNANQ